MTVNLPTGDEKRTTVTAMFDRVAPSYDKLNRLISLGQDRRWRRHTIDSLAITTGRVLDLACGTGDLCRELGDRGLTAIGFDLSPGMLQYAAVTTPLVRADTLRLPVADGAADGITCGFALRNFTDLGAFARECARVLRPGGRIALLDASEPANPIMRAGHTIWFRHAVPRIGGWLGDAQAYRYLPASTAYLPTPDALLDLFTAAGFTDIRRRTFTGGAVQLITGSRT
ncbi:MAG: ubiquinone/menaquinone biosynthesis methyltransferase [Acidimicrobiia bacterium]|nr:ubiquinone/menaquinone biosynthesis methyltransferase [Acidimicrobiia bacterium]